MTSQNIPNNVDIMYYDDLLNMLDLDDIDLGDLEDIDNIVNYLKRFVSSAAIDIEGRHIDVTFSDDTKLAKLINRLGVDKVELQIAADLEGYGGAGVVIHTPDINAKPDMIGDIRQEDEEYSEDAENEVTSKDLQAQGIETPRFEDGKVPTFKESTTLIENNVLSYMSEQRIYSTPKPIVESVSFKEKFKPKTAKQLAELKNYGM